MQLLLRQAQGRTKSGTGARSRRLGLDEIGGVFSGRSRGSRGHRRGDGESDGAAVDGPKPNRSECVVFSQAILEPDEVGSGRGHQRDRGPTRLEVWSLEIVGLIGAGPAGHCVSGLLGGWRSCAGRAWILTRPGIWRVGPGTMPEVRRLGPRQGRSHAGLEDSQGSRQVLRQARGAAGPEVWRWVGTGLPVSLLPRRARWRRIGGLPPAPETWSPARQETLWQSAWDPVRLDTDGAAAPGELP